MRSASSWLRFLCTLLHVLLDRNLQVLQTGDLVLYAYVYYIIVSLLNKPS